MKILAFVAVTVLVVALAGPFPHLIIGGLVLIISGMVLSRWQPIASVINDFGTALTPAKAA